MNFEFPTGWDDLTWEQLIGVHNLIKENMDVDRTIMKLRIWLWLMRLDFRDGDCDINEDGREVYWLHRTDVDDDELFEVGVEELYLHINGVHVPKEEGREMSAKERQMRIKIERKGALDWLDNPLGLTTLNKEWIEIGSHRYQLPQQMLTNLTYEQYSNVQKLIGVVSTLSESLAEDMKDTTEEELGKDAAKMSDMQRRLEEIKGYRSRAISHLLTLGKQDKKTKRWKWAYSSDASEDDAENMNNAPEWLFDILHQHMQGCLSVYKGQFPDLFSGGDGSGDDKIPLVNETNTVNAVMKWQGYTGQQEVYDSNAVFVFSILNSMTKEAKAIEEANAKMKARSH